MICQRCGFESARYKKSILEPWMDICLICYHAEKKKLARKKSVKSTNTNTLSNFLRSGKRIIQPEKKESAPEPKVDSQVVMVDTPKVNKPIVRVVGTEYIMDRFKAYKGKHMLNEEEKNVLSLADIRTYQGKKREVTAQWLIKEFTNPGDVVLDPFSGSGMFSLVAKVNGRKPIAFDILRSAVSITNAMINTPKRRDIIRVAHKIAENSVDYVVDIEDFPKSILKWYDIEVFKKAIRLFKYIEDNELGMDERMQNFQRQIALYILARSSYGKGGYGWRLDEVEYRRRAIWNKDIFEEYIKHVKKVVRNKNPKQYNTNFKCYRQSIIEPTKLADGSVDRIVTDPPYGDMIDYIAQSWVEEWYLGWKDLVTKDEILGISATPKKALEFAHKNMIQDIPTFFDRMEIAMKEMYRVLRSDGTAVFIIGDFKEQRTVGKQRYTSYINPYRPLENIARKIGFKEIYVINKRFERQSTFKHTHGGEVKYERVIIFRKGTREDDIITDRVIEKPKIGLELFF